MDYSCCHGDRQGFAFWVRLIPVIKRKVYPSLWPTADLNLYLFIKMEAVVVGDADSRQSDAVSYPQLRETQNSTFIVLGILCWSAYHCHTPLGDMSWCLAYIHLHIIEHVFFLYIQPTIVFPTPKVVFKKVLYIPHEYTCSKQEKISLLYKFIYTVIILFYLDMFSLIAACVY